MSTLLSIESFNNLSAEEASTQLTQCCAAEAWVARMIAVRPFSSLDHVVTAAGEHWVGLSEGDYLQAFDAHPKIGDVNSLREKYADTKAMAGGEQSGVNSAGEDVIQRLSEGNTAYQDKFGFIFIVCATGKSAEEMLALLEARRPNSRDDELTNAAAEQAKITEIRLRKLLTD